MTLKRTGNWARKVPLNSNLPLSSRSRLSSNGRLKRTPPPVFKPPRPKSLPKSLPKTLRDIVWARDEGRCVMCGLALPDKGWECHHRVLRSQGGRDEPANLLALHGPTCHTKAHQNPTWAKRRGYIVHPSTDPATRPVLRHGEDWQLPAPGRWVDSEAPSDYIEEKAA